MVDNSERTGDSLLAEGLRRLLLAVEASGRAVLPGSSDELLQTVVEAATRLFGAAASSIALVNEQDQVLEFVVATGAGSEQVVGMKVPIDQGIAGYVAATGQPMAVSDAQLNARFARHTAEQTGYVPRSILAMPLVSNDRVIGVIEVLDKINAPSFGMQDMELLGIFAHQAAIAIHASQQYMKLGEALREGLQGLLGGDGSAEAQSVLRALAEPPDESSAADLRALATLFGAIAELGPAERQACLQVLAAFATYARSRAGYGR